MTNCLQRRGYPSEKYSYARRLEFKSRRNRNPGDHVNPETRENLATLAMKQISIRQVLLIATDQPMISETKINWTSRVSVASVFPRFSAVVCICFEFQFVHWLVVFIAPRCDWSETTNANCNRRPKYSSYVLYLDTSIRATRYCLLLSAFGIK